MRANPIPRLLLILAALLPGLTLTGCSGAIHVATSAADANQKPPVVQYASKKPGDAVFTAAVKAMGTLGKVVASDRTSGVVQGEKGNWVINASVGANGKGTRLDISARYVPSKRFDFNSREELTQQFVALVEQQLGEPLTLAASQ